MRIIDKLLMSLCVLAMPCMTISSAFADDGDFVCPVDSKRTKTECTCDVPAHHNGQAAEDNINDVIASLKSIKPQIRECFSAVSKSKQKGVDQIKHCNFQINLSIALNGKINFSRIFGCAVDEAVADLNSQTTQCISDLFKKLRFCPGYEASRIEGEVPPTYSEKPLNVDVDYQYKKNAFSKHKDNPNSGESAAPGKRKVSL